MMSLRAGKDAPPNLDYIIAPQLNDLDAQTLPAGQSLTLPLRAEWGQQISLAVVGLEPAGAEMAACCMSVQRVHLPASCPSVSDTESPSLPSPDLAISISHNGECGRPDATPHCVATLDLSQIAGDPVADAPIFVTVTGQDARALNESEGACSKMVGGEAVCALSLNRPWVVDVALDAGRPASTFELCATLGVPENDTARTLALQQALGRAGYPVGAADGKFGPATVAALTQFIDDSGLPPITAEIPPEALVLLGLSPREDANPANNRACAVLRVPAPPLQCDKRTTHARGGECACVFKDMSRVSASKCACPKGKVLGPQGCVTREVVVDGSKSDGDAKLCNNPTVVQKDGECLCRFEGTRMAKGGLCLCKSGLPPLPGVGCAVSFSIDISPEKPRETDAP